jgi:hypothetical protein
VALGPMVIPERESGLHSLPALPRLPGAGADLYVTLPHPHQVLVIFFNRTIPFFSFLFSNR